MENMIFRVWAEEFKSFLGSALNNLYIDFENGKFTKDNDRGYISEQYIGIKSTNGNQKIFEGDICRIKGGVSFNGIYEFDKVGVIKRQSVNFDFCIKNVGHGLGFALDYESVELLGNIHQDAEMYADIL
jgi:hypothetical protein